MARPTKDRSICEFPKQSEFGPIGRNRAGQEDDVITLHLDEYETIRLIDMEKMTQEECSKQMDVARTTIQAIYENAREKIAIAIVEGKRLVIAGGNYRLCMRNKGECNKFHCRRNGNEEGLGRKKRGESC
ncbi:MAG: DUF134 domain-containing protein [Firmicutes bacterium]|nr:DUF134 domain-containing protein [Bacillota bacterium]